MVKMTSLLYKKLIFSAVTGLISSINFKMVNSTPIETEKRRKPIFNRWIRFLKFEKHSKNATLFDFFNFFCFGNFLPRKPFVWSPKSVSQWNNLHFFKKNKTKCFLVLGPGIKILVVRKIQKVLQSDWYHYTTSFFPNIFGLNFHYQDLNRQLQTCTGALNQKLHFFVFTGNYTFCSA